METNELHKERVKLLSEIAKLSKEISTYNASSEQSAEIEAKFNKERIRLGRELQRINANIRDNQKQLYVDAQRSASDMNSIYTALNQVESQRIKSMSESIGITDLAVTRANELADINRKISQLTDAETIERQLLQDEFDKTIIKLSKQKNIGKDIIDNLTLQNKKANNLADLTEAQKEQLEAQIRVYDGIEKSIVGAIDTVELLVSNLSAGIGFSAIALGQVVGKISEVNREFGMTLLSSNGVARNTALMNVFFDDAVGTTQELAAQFGSTEAASFGTQLNTNLLARNLGISGKEAATLAGSFARLNGGSIQTANNLMVSTKELAKQRGVIPARVMADLANNTEAFALYARDGGRNLAQASVFAQQLGVDMGVLTGIADNLLDFESSITKELELSAMLGRSINLNKARELAFSGEIEEATREALRQMGGIDEFNRMDVFQKRSAAQLLGVSVAQLQQMVDLEAKSNTEVGMLAKSYNFLNESATALTNTMGGPFLSTLGSSLVALGQMSGGLQNIIGLEKLKTAWLKISSVFRKKETAELAAQKVLSDKQITAGFGGKATKDTLLGTGTGTITPTTGKSVGGFTESISKINMNAVLKGAAALAIVAGAMFILGKALQEFEGIGWDTLAVAGVALLGLTASVAALGVVGKFAIVGAAALLVVASSVLVIGYALQAMGTGFSMLSDGITSLVPTISSVGSVVSGLITQIAPITLLSTAFFGLAASLMAVGAAGLVALPALTAIAVTGGVVGTVARLIGVGGGDSGEKKKDELLNEIRGLRKDLNDGKVAVYMDGRKVTASVSRVVDRIGTNMYG